MTVKSQDDLGQRGRSVDVLTTAIDLLKILKAENAQLRRENLMFKIANAELNDRLTIKKGLQYDQ
jgi:hypothetical protein